MAKLCSISILVICSLMLTDCITANFQIPGSQMMKRQTDSIKDMTICSNFDNCEDCNTAGPCLFMNSQCTNDPQSEIFEERYNSEEDHIYCYNSKTDGNIDLHDEDGYQLLIKHDKSATSTFHPICEWKINIDKNANVIIILERNKETYEDIVFREYSENHGYQFFPLKGFINCEAETIRLEGDSMEELTIRTKILNDASSYSMLVSQYKTLGSHSNVFGIVLISVFLFILATCLILIFIICCLWINTSMRRRRRVQLQRIHYFERSRSKRQRIDDTMNKMRNGLFMSFNTDYDQTQCVVCLEDFSPEAEVHLTNECRHVFHSKCLFEWYQAINPIRDLHCPHCNTVNSCNSTPPSENDDKSQEQETSNHDVQNLTSVDRLNASFEGNIAEMPHNHTGVVVSRNMVML